MEAPQLFFAVFTIFGETMTRTKSVFIGIAIVAAGFAGMSLMMANKPKPPKKPLEDTSPLVEVMQPQVQSVQLKVEAHGVVQPRTETSLVSEVSGVVQEVSDRFVAGGHFSKGEVLLQIDPSDYLVSVEQAKARLASQQAKYEQEKARAEQARKEWDMTGRSRKSAPLLALREPFLQEAKANVQSAQADLKKAEQKLARTVIRAPYAGMVKSKKVDIGQYVGVGNPLGVTFAIDYAEVRLPLTDQELAFIDLPGWAEENSVLPDVTLKANYAGSAVEWPAKLVRMEGGVNEQSRVHYTVARISDPYALLQKDSQQQPLKVGSFVTAVIHGKQLTDVVKLPREAFRDLDKVMVSDKNNQLHIRRLNVVRAQADIVYVDGGLEAGDRIVMTTLESPVQGMKLRILGDKEEEKQKDEQQDEAEDKSQNNDKSQPQAEQTA